MYEESRSRVIIASTKREERLLSELAQTRKTLDDKVSLEGRMEEERNSHLSTERELQSALA